jgi:hypothetical protein
MLPKADTELVTRGGSLALSGFVDADVLALFLERLAELSPEDRPVAIELSHATFEQEAFADRLARAIRALAARLGVIHVHGAPRAVRAALQGAPSVELRDPR